MSGVPYFAWCAAGEPFDPVLHRRKDDDVTDAVIVHDERGNATAKVSFPIQSGGAITQDKEACHISAEIDGVLRHLFYGLISYAPIGTGGTELQVQFLSRHPNYRQLLADQLAPVMANPTAYVPEMGRAADATDETNILAATTNLIEYDRTEGKPHLTSFFGSKDLFRVITGEFVVNDSFESSTENPPPAGVLITLQMEATQRRHVLLDGGAMIQTEIDRIASLQPYGLPQYAGNYTFTPDVLKDWYKPGTSIGNEFQIGFSFLIATDGPGTIPKTAPFSPSVKVVAKKKKASGPPKDADDIAPDGDQEAQKVDLVPTGFSNPVFTVEGILSRQRRELVTIYLPFEGQQLINGNGPIEYLNLTIDSIDSDSVTPEYKPGYYNGGEIVQQDGFTWICLRPVMSSKGPLAEHYALDFNDPDVGREIWAPLGGNESPLQNADVDALASSSYGRRVIANMVRRGVVLLSDRARLQEYEFTVPLSVAWDIDPRWTVRVESQRINRAGWAEGKVVGIDFVFDGSKADGFATIRIACCIGSGNGDQTPGTGEPGDGLTPNDPTYDPQSYYTQVRQGGYPRPSWWPSIYSWPPSIAEDPLNFYAAPGERGEEDPGYLNRGLNFQTDPYDPGLYEDVPKPVWWPQFLLIDDEFDPVYQDFYDWPPDRLTNCFGVDDDSPWAYQEGQSRAVSAAAVEPVAVPVTGESGWDEVRYLPPVYAPVEIDTDVLRCRINWLGFEQAYALENPGKRIRDPYGTFTPDGQPYPTKGVVYVQGQEADAFLNECKTEIDIYVRSAEDVDSGPPQPVSITVTQGWNGPKQVEL